MYYGATIKEIDVLKKHGIDFKTVKKDELKFDKFKRIYRFMFSNISKSEIL